MNILLLENIHSVAIKQLGERGHKVTTMPSALSPSELEEKLKDFQILGIRSKTKVTASVFEKNPQLLGIGCFCIGTNQVDLEASLLNGVPVFNAPYSNTRSVAELVISEIVALSRHLCDLSAQAHQGLWKKTAQGRFEVRGKTLGIIGYGHIGSQVGILAEAMGLNIIYYDVLKKLPLGNCSECSSLKELLEQSDFVTLHVPATPETVNLIGAKEIQSMKKGSYLLNLSRGSVVDLSALASSLKEGHIAGAALDVYPSEPKSNDEKFTNVLQGIPNVILTPHVGGSTEEAQKNIGLEVSEALGQYLNFGLTPGAVEFPRLNPTPPKKGERILNIHDNKPGVLGAINEIVSTSGINIHSQFLGTYKDIGYLILDVEQNAQDIMVPIAQLETSIKTRLC